MMNTNIFLIHLYREKEIYSINKFLQFSNLSCNKIVKGNNLTTLRRRNNS